MNSEHFPEPNWAPFLVNPADRQAPAPRSIHLKEGIADRLRAAAFAEKQALEAFRWAAARFVEVPEEARQGWLYLAEQEQIHMDWLLTRLQELGFDVEERPVSNRLWDSFRVCRSGVEFAHYMASAEDRGREAGEKFFRALKDIDLVSAEIFRKIAEEEKAHIDLARRLFGWTPDSQALHS